MAGLFIALEGPEGAGKTTLLRRLAHRIREHGIETVEVREPGGTPLAEAARTLVLDPAVGAPPAAELFLLLAARADLVERVIRPALARGATVLSDRYDLSTMAYQVEGRGLPREAVIAANRLATGGLTPDVMLVLDVPAEVGRARQAAAGKTPDRMEREDEALHERVVRAFGRARGPGVIHVDATQPPEAVEAAVWKVVAGRVRETFGLTTG